MVITWMLYCTAVSALLGVGALALARTLAALGRPTRWAWAGALSASAASPLVLPALRELRRSLLPQEPAAAGAALGETQSAPETASLAAAPSAWETADLLLLPAWGAATLVLAAGACVLLAALHLRRRRWRRATVAGTPVLVSPRTGPAVVGFLRGRVVLPEWALAWDAERQRMMVEHEREHLRARDPLLLLAAFAAAAAVPWNAALWWQLRRLRLAVEVDCDARVLRRGSDVRGYGLLLLEVGRVAAAGRLPAVALAEPPSFLERRIRAMTSPRLERGLRRAALSAAVCGGALAIAAALPAPAGSLLGGEPSPAGGIRRAATDTIPLRPGLVDVGNATDKPRLVNAEQVQRLLQNHYPPLLRDAGITGTAQVQMVVTETGAVGETSVLEATRPEFGQAAELAMRQARFAPAKLDGRAVAVRVQLPVTFSPGEGSTEVRGAPVAGGEVGPSVVDVAELDRKPTLTNAAQVGRLLQEIYPPLLRDAGIAGDAQVTLVVRADGFPEDVRLVSASHPAFGEAAVAVLRAARFTPGSLGGRTTAARVQVPVSFSLEAGAPPRDR